MSTLSVKIGAILDGSFNSAMAGSSAQLSRLGGTIRQLDTSIKSVSKFKELSSGVSVAGQSWRKLERRVKALAQEMKKTEKPSKDLKAKFDKASTSVIKTRTDYLKKKEALRVFSEELRKSGRDIKSLIRDQDKLGASVGRLRSQYNKLNFATKAYRSFSAKRTHFKSQLLETGALALTLGTPFKAAIDFESAMANIKAVIKLSDDKEDNDGEFMELGKMLKELSRTIPLSAAELAQITTSGARLGIKEKKDLLEFTEIVSKMAVNFGMNVEEIGSDVSSFYNIYKMSLKDLRNLGDLVNHLASNTSVEAKDLMAGINIASGAARQFGLEIEQIAGLYQIS
ncbi:phage tail tape measure protein [Wolbachia endosymbiont (group A) of Clivina fossor]|uniref:phage tail tape measure protein n=1 Tax=Wolbachia endosymbiont (group A) of Clivina fossor TaxID=3066133 RepID=UPI0031333362